MKKILYILGILLVTASLVFAGESDSKDDTGDKAIELYNSGVAHMDKAKDIIAVGDSAFAYNYRATSDAKATKEYEKAIADFKDALKLQPDMKEAYNNLGYCYRKIGKLELSYKNYQRALNFDPDFVQALEYLGETYLAMDSLNAALANLKHLTELKSPYADTLSKAIEIYKLNQVNQSLKSKKN